MDDLGAALPILAAIAVCWVLPAALCAWVSRTGYELHAYQYDFLTAMAAAKLPTVEACAKEHGVTGAAAALQTIVMQAVQDSVVHGEIYDEFHCVHCGSVTPEPWIKERKGKKEKYPLAVTTSVSTFLAKELLVPVEKLGQPPKRQVVSGPRRADPSKAARVAIDWAIKKYDALTDGKPKEPKEVKATRAAKSPKRR